MKKLFTSAGLVVVGAASLQAQYAPAPGLTPAQTSKPFSVAASLRGFYDDNYNTAPNGPAKRDSFGFAVNPQVGYNFTGPTTYLGLSYDYVLKYFEDRPRSKADHSHLANLKLKHDISDQYKLDVSDTFVVGQEPELFAGSDMFSTVNRIPGNNVGNRGAASFTAGLSDRFSTMLSYSNRFYDYAPLDYSALLDRMEHLGGIGLNFELQPTTILSLNYQYGVTEFAGNKILPSGVPSNWRDNTSHYVFLGIDQTFAPDLRGSLRVGAQATQYDKYSNRDVISPYADANLTYAFNPGSSFQVGVKHTRTATDSDSIAAAAEPTLDKEATLVYAQLTHKVGKLTGSLLAQYQKGEFNGGALDGQSEDFFLAGANLSYEINQFLSADIGYNFDRLDSDLLNRDYSRNRVYIGIRASY